MVEQFWQQWRTILKLQTYWKGYALFRSRQLAKNQPDVLNVYQAVCAPAHNGATSLMQVDAYKRLILVQCLLNGKVRRQIRLKYCSPRFF